MDEGFDFMSDIPDSDDSPITDNVSDMVDDVPEDISNDIADLTDTREYEPVMPDTDDLPDDITEDVQDDVSELTEENELPEDIPEDVEDISDYELDMTEEDDLPEDISAAPSEATEEHTSLDDFPEDISEAEQELSEEDDMPENIPEDVLDNSEDATGEYTSPDDFPEDVPFAEPEISENSEFDEEDLNNTPTMSSEADNNLMASELENSGLASNFDESVSDDAPKVLKRDEFDLLKSGNDAINQRLDAQADDYRDKGLSDDEIKDRLAADRWNFQKEFLEDAFPGQDVSPNVFNGFSENGARDRLTDIENSKTLREQLQAANDEGIADTTPQNFSDDMNTSDADETDWLRTSLRRSEEEQLRDMEKNGELNVIPEDSDLEDPEHTKLHLPSEKTGEFFGERGNSDFLPDSDAARDKISQYGRDTVEYKNGYPDFAPFTTHDSEWGKINGQVEIGHMTDQRENPTWDYGRRPSSAGHDPNYDLGNFAQADNEIADQLRSNYPDVTGDDIAAYRNANHLIWHECADGKTMQLVPEEIHNACRHSGGVSEMKYRMAWGDVARPID